MAALSLPLSSSQSATPRELFNHLGFSYIRQRAHSKKWKLWSAPKQYNSSSSRCRIKRFQLVSAKNYEAGQSEDAEEIVHKSFDDLTDTLEDKTIGKGSSFLSKLAIGLVDGSSSSTISAPAPGFSFKAFGCRVKLPEYAPGWIYFWLLMAAGFGLFISEEALNIWVGIAIAWVLVLDGTWQSLVNSFSRNAPYITSTVLWVYWGVCISDMIPFYVGKFFKQSGASDNVCSKLGIGTQKERDITNAVQKYGNLIGFGYITRMFLCRCLLRRLDNSSNSVDNWIFTKRESSICSCNRYYCSGPKERGGEHMMQAWMGCCYYLLKINPRLPVSSKSN